jgi:hypothetical protein
MTTDTGALAARAPYASEDEALRHPLALPLLLRYVVTLYTVDISNKHRSAISMAESFLGASSSICTIVHAP